MSKNVIVTGGSRGIGFAIASAFAQEGNAVLLVARNASELEKAKQKLAHTKGIVTTFMCDVSKEDNVRSINAHIKEKWNGKIDVLVNAAGIYGPKGFLEDNNFELWRKTFEVNVFGTARMCRAVLPYMKSAGLGRIINFSGGGDGEFPRFTAYSSSKGAVVRFTESLAAETKENGITVNAIAPGAVNTHLMEEVLKAGAEKVGEDFYKRTLEQKESGGTSPKKAAGLACFLASDRADFITGKVLSAVHDKWEEFEKHKKEIENTEVYNMRRIKLKR
jgi:NAD(P)-dependent dehydrogenase (short-subunit alcohol dehydrogenase family)